MSYHLQVHKSSGQVLGLSQFAGLAPDADFHYVLLTTSELTKYKLLEMQQKRVIKAVDVIQGALTIIPSANQVPAPKVVKVAPAATPATAAKVKSSKAETAKMLGEFMRASKRSSK